MVCRLNLPTARGKRHGRLLRVVLPQADIRTEAETHSTDCEDRPFYSITLSPESVRLTACLRGLLSCEPAAMPQAFTVPMTNAALLMRLMRPSDVPAWAR